MNTLYQKIREDVIKWRTNNYKSNYFEIGEILNFQFIGEHKTNLKFLRTAQFEALETYLYLRFVKNTSHIIDLYKAYFPKPKDLIKALNINLAQDDLIELLANGGIENLFNTIQTDNGFVKKYKLENVRESLSLQYPSYILSLVMGAGKTILIGTIIFIEFALSLITKKDCFLKNALVFAPGKTIIGSLREISVISIQKILPLRFANILESNLKITYTSDKEKNISVVHSSNYNIIITNIEKIRILSKIVKRNLLNPHQQIRQGEKENTVNLRLQTLASLDNLGIFSDEAHNTYGQQLDKSIKKVRQTIDYLAQNTNLKIVVNTTGTPYFKKRILKDVVFWYGLLEGIEQNVLKDVRGNIYSYSQVDGKEFIGNVVDDFFTTYKDVKIEGGYPSKIAIYFPKVEDVKKIKPFITQKIGEYGLSPNAIFEINAKSNEKDKDIFINRINDPTLPYRIFLLVGMGKEGWNCPSLFACCLARDLGNSNNFVLQAATRCLRQLPKNHTSARIYLSDRNTKILDGQLQENYGEELHHLDLKAENKWEEQTIKLIKYDRLPKIKITRKVKKYIQKEATIKNINIEKPVIKEQEKATLIKYDFSKIVNTKSILSLTEKEILAIKKQNTQKLSLFEVANEIASLYAIDIFVMLKKLQKHFPNGKLSKAEFTAIKTQLEKQIDNYTAEEEEIEEWLTIIKKEGFEEQITKKGTKVYTTTILVHKEKLALLKDKANYKHINDLSFHYNPYKFDSNLEVSLFEWAIEQIQEKKENIKDFLFVGGITDRDKTDLIFEYRDKDGRLRNYTPDFLILKNNGETIFLETKGKHLAENFKVKEKYFKTYLKDQFKYKLLVSEGKNIRLEDKEWLQKEI